MADAARLVIEIEDRPGPAPRQTSAAPAPGGPVSSGPDADEVTRNGRHAGQTHPQNTPPAEAPGRPGASVPPNAPAAPGGPSPPQPGAGGPRDSFDTGASPFREHIGRTQQALRGVGPAGRSYEQLAKDSLASGGRPADASDEEWLWYSRESGKRGQAAGRAAVKGAEARQKEEEKRQKEMEKVRQEEETRQKELADKVEKERLAKEQQHATWAATAAQGAAAAATGEEGAGKAAGRSVGSAVGSAAGQALGAAFGGPIGAAIGGAVGSEVGGKLGEKIGEQIDDPLNESTKVINAMNKAVQLAGRAFVQVAGGDAIGLFTTATEAAAEQIEQIPGVGKMLAAEFRLLSGTVGSAKAVLDAFATRGKELAGYNGALAGASARQDVALLLADIREANQLGAKMSKVIDAQTKLDLFMREMLIPIKEAIADKLPGAVDLGIQTLIACLKVLEFSAPGFEFVFGKMSDDLRRMREAAEAGMLADPLGVWFAGFDAIAGPAAPGFAMDPGVPMPAPVAAPFGAP